ncbi:predicted protein [Chaetomium globosum CBS 148.51]|uniref:N-acetyltransferase domain-containing protein n=1 Tax=Chaetomium globosum (strain ATCC 6205 / CBS 148.51 / DSM 1962 / NBRC 6347 / NRRL 1970) TaxID=306901 RepID=Q2HCQ3_CHAGB|nr:uncharacterized protein CHGG_02001 [Chaetomium globosum CBS 148.51]EAQ93766.1 predicted protein [Chaetomium globosum CBS 148.51]
MTVDSDVLDLPPGYEIRKLNNEHLSWVQAIVAHTMSFDSAVWSKVDYPGGATQRAYDMYHAIRQSSLQSIQSGLSYGVFCTEYKCRTPGLEGTLDWDFNDLSADDDDLLEQMDFPLVSIAMSKDAAEDKPVPETGVKPWSEIVPGHAIISNSLKAGDNRPQSVWSPEHMGEVVRRSGTHTRGDHAGKGLSKVLAHHIMREIRDHEQGYKAILIHTGGEAVDKVWLRPPAPFKSEEICPFSTSGYHRKDDHSDTSYNPFGSAKVVSRRIWVTWPLKEDKEELPVLNLRRRSAVVIADVKPKELVDGS